MSAVPQQYLSLDEYFRLEETSEIKHEYYRGTSYNMTGASEAHNLIVANIIGQLNPQLIDKPCRVYPSDLRLKVEAAELYTYPDAIVICGPSQYADGRKDTVTNPTLLIEVLSPGTENYDRGAKFQNYRMIDTLHDYLMIAQDGVHVEHYIRQDNHAWLLRDFTDVSQVIDLPTICCSLALDAIYRNILFEQGPDA